MRRKEKPMWERLRDCHGDVLAWRQLMLETNGRETLINCIFGAHGKPNRY